MTDNRLELAVEAPNLFLLWLWLTNWSLLAGGEFDAEFDAELERMRQLRSGLDAEKSISVPMRQSRTVTTAASLRIRDVRAAER